MVLKVKSLNPITRSKAQKDRLWFNWRIITWAWLSQGLFVSREVGKEGKSGAGNRAVACDSSWWWEFICPHLSIPVGPCDPPELYLLSHVFSPVSLCFKKRCSILLCCVSPVHHHRHEKGKENPLHLTAIWTWKECGRTYNNWLWDVTFQSTPNKCPVVCSGGQWFCLPCALCQDFSGLGKHQLTELFYFLLVLWECHTMRWRWML